MVGFSNQMPNKNNCTSLDSLRSFSLEVVLSVHDPAMFYFVTNQGSRSKTLNRQNNIETKKSQEA